MASLIWGHLKTTVAATLQVKIDLTLLEILFDSVRETEKKPHKMSSQETTPQKSPVEKTPCPHPILGLVEKTPHPIFRFVEKTPQLYKKISFWNFHIFYLNCIQILTPPLYKEASYWNFDIYI